MAPALRLGPAAYCFTGRAEGDFGSAAERGPSGPRQQVSARRRALVDRPWLWLRQVHGADVGVVTGDGDATALVGREADAAVLAPGAGAALCILTADCAPIALSSPEGVLGATHAGWRGLAEGVVGATVEAMRGLGATSVEAALGPCIHPECYEFSPDDLDEVARRLGPHVRGRTAAGSPALDLPGAVRTELDRSGVTVSFDAGECTACAVGEDDEPKWFSHRARGEQERQALVVWRP